MTTKPRRTAEEVIPGGRRLRPQPPTGPCTRYTVVAARRTGAVRVTDGRVVKAGTATEFQRLVGLTEDALRAYAVAHGWTLTAKKVTP